MPSSSPNFEPFPLPAKRSFCLIFPVRRGDNFTLIFILAMRWSRINYIGMDYLFVRKFGKEVFGMSIMNNNILMERRSQFSVRIV